MPKLQASRLQSFMRAATQRLSHTQTPLCAGQEARAA
jgi:hypothetical protein